MTTNVLIGNLNAATDPAYLTRSDLLPLERDGLTQKASVTGQTVDIVNVYDFGAIGNGTADDSASFNDTIAEAYTVTNLVATIPGGTFAINAIFTSQVSLVGLGQASVLIANDTTQILILGYDTFGAGWAKRLIANLVLDGNLNTSNGISYGDEQYGGRWVLERVVIQSCVYGIYKPVGNIGNCYRDCTFSDNNFGYYALGSGSPTMHGGNDLFENCHLSGNSLAAIYIDSDVTGTGQTTFRNNTIIESNPGFGIFVNNYRTSYTPIVLDGVWFENNATSGTVTINSVSYTPVDLYLRNADFCVLKNGIVPKIQLVNSKLTIDRCFITENYSSLNIDSDSVCYGTNMYLDGGMYAIVIQSIASFSNQGGNRAPIFLANKRSVLTHSQTNYLQSITYANANTYTFPGTGTVTATTAADGLIFDSCCQISIPVSATQIQATITITASKYYVTTLDVKFISGSLADLVLNITKDIAFMNSCASLLQTGKWVTIASISKAETTGEVRLNIQNLSASVVQILRLSALQITEFDTREEAISYYNSGTYTMPLLQPRVTYSTVAPTTGTWAVGDSVINAAPSVGQPKSWMCTVAGTPGTWVSTGNL